MREPGADDDEPLSFTDREVMEALRATIPAEDVLTREGVAGRVERYIKEWAVRKRLDQAAGHENWSVEYEVLFKTSDDWPILVYRCRLRVTLPSGRVVPRDGIGTSPLQQLDPKTGLPKPRGMKLPDALKAGATDSFKKAGAAFGIGTDLEDPVDDGSYQGTPPSQRQPREPRGSWGSRSGDDFDETRRQPQREEPRPPPKTGRALFAWAADMTKQLDDGTDVVKALQAYGKANGYPDRLVEWAPDQVDAGHRWAVAKAENRPAAME